MNQTVGEFLRQTRIRQNRTLSDISASTHIRARFLEALENDTPDQIPSLAQMRGFLRLYAATLGLSADSLLAIWDTPEPDPALPEEAAPQHESRFRIKMPKLDIRFPKVRIPIPEVMLVRFPSLRRFSSSIGKLPENAEISEPETRAAVEELPENIIEEAAPTPILEDLPTYLSEYEGIGQELRTRRDGLGLTLEDVELHTRLKRHHLASLEDGRMDDLPSPVQARGMMRNYIEFLNLDADALFSRYANALQIRRKAFAKSSAAAPTRQTTVTAQKKKAQLNPPTSKPDQGRIPILKFLSLDLIVGGFLIIALFGFIIWGALQIINLRTGETASNAPSISEILMTTPTLTPEQTVTAGDDASTTPTQEIIIAADGGEITATSAPTSSAPLQVVVVANSRAYLLVTVDGSVRFSGRVNPGNAQTFTGSTRISVESGNAAAFQIIFNQDDLGSLGDTGQILRMIFTSTGVQTATPQFSITPTHTQPATLTPQPSPTVPTPTVTPFVP